MNKLIFAVAAIVAVLLFPGSAQASPKEGWYLGTAAGATFQEPTNVKSGGVKNKLFFDPGFALSGSIGYGLDSQFRPELEISYRRSMMDIPHGPGAGGAHGNLGTLAFMGNLLYDIDTQSALTPYLGVGAGGALLQADKIGNIFGGNTIDNAPFEFAYQAIGGASLELSENVDLTLDYRYFRTLEPGFKLKTGGAKVTDAEMANHTVMLGLRFTFGVPKPVYTEVVTQQVVQRPMVVMPQPMPMPYVRPVVIQAPPVAAPPPAVPETYIVFFDFDKYYLTAEAKETLQHAADAFLAGGVARVEITGHTDTMGSLRYNKRLSERRARVVKQYMTALGIPEDEIGTRGAGEGELMVATGDNVREAKNRRAEIVMRP